MSKTKKAKIIEQLLLECNGDGTKLFDKLYNLTPQHLDKLLKVAKIL